MPAWPTCLLLIPGIPDTHTHPLPQSNEEGLVLISEAIKSAGHEGKIKIAMDCAASEFYGVCVCWWGGGQLPAVVSACRRICCCLASQVEGS